MKKIYSYVYALIFLVVIILPVLAYVVPIASKMDENRENRVLAKIPKIDLKRLDPFPKAFEKYYNDNFNFREDLLALNSYIKYNYYKESPHASVIIGKHDWLFIKKYKNSYINKEVFSDEELANFRKLYTKRSLWLKERGIKNYVFIIPTKYNTYPEYLPPIIYKYTDTNKKQQFIEATKSIDNLKVIDLLPYFLEHKNESATRLFHKTDQHWNEYGAFVACTKIIQELKKDFGNIELINANNSIIKTNRIQGKDLAKTILMEDKLFEDNIKVTLTNNKIEKFTPEYTYEVPGKFPYKDKIQKHYRTDKMDLPKVLVIRDSFSNYVYHLLPNSFRESVFIWDSWCYLLNEEIVENERPDIFITLIIESNLSYILYKHPSVR